MRTHAKIAKYISRVSKLVVPGYAKIAKYISRVSKLFTLNYAQQNQQVQSDQGTRSALDASRHHGHLNGSETIMRTDENLIEICNQLRQNYGDFHGACRRAGLSLDFVTNWMRDDREAASQIDEAQRVGFMGLESAAIQRGVHGVEKAVYYKGEVVGYETQYSDSLLSKMLEARAPAYKKGEGAQTTFNGPTQINIMPRADSYEQWLEMKTATLAKRDDTQFLPPPKVPEILQGQYVEVTPNKVLEGLL